MTDRVTAIHAIADLARRRVAGIISVGVRTLRESAGA
jgi:hypothetical protein